jgi:hypothetical protein
MASRAPILAENNPSTLEAMTCREALALAQDLQISHLCIASACLEVIKSLQGTFMGIHAMITEEVKASSSLFTSVVFKHEG